MANVLRLANVGQTSTYSLLSGDLNLRDNTWRTQTSPQIGFYKSTSFGTQVDFSHYDPVLEQMDLVSTAGSSNIRQAANDIEDFLENARKFHADPLNVDSQWLEWNVDGESAKRSLIYDGSLAYPNYIGAGPMLPTSKSLASLVVTRHPFWESYPHVDESISGLSCTGGMDTLAAIPGKVPARIREMAIYGNSALTGYLTEFWFGWREEYSGTAFFDGVIECEDGTNDTDARDIAEGGTSSGNKVQVDFSTETGLERRMRIAINQHVLVDDFRGRYRVLCRCKTTAALTTIGIQLRTGYTSTAGSWVAPQEEVFIDHTKWKLVELGEWSIPSMTISEAMNLTLPIVDCGVELWAEQVEGSGYLDLDCLILIPSEHFLYLEGAAVYYSGGGQNPLYVYTTETDQVTAYARYASYVRNNVTISANNWYIPTGNVMLVTAAQRSDKHDLNDNIGITLDYYPRWLSYRES